MPGPCASLESYSALHAGRPSTATHPRVFVRLCPVCRLEVQLEYGRRLGLPGVPVKFDVSFDLTYTKCPGDATCPDLPHLSCDNVGNIYAEDHRPQRRVGGSVEFDVLGSDVQGAKVLEKAVGLQLHLGLRLKIVRDLLGLGPELRLRGEHLGGLRGDDQGQQGIIRTKGGKSDRVPDALLVCDPLDLPVVRGTRGADLPHGVRV